MTFTHVKTLIIGAGPSGSVCGYTLVKNNEECLLIDKHDFPREKLCGGGLTGKAHLFLKEIYPDFEYNFYPAKEMEILWHNKSYCTFHLNPEIRVVERYVFDKLLLDRYLNAGGRFLKAKAQKIEEKEGKVFVTLSDGRVISCDRLIGADSANSIVRKYLQPGYNKGVVCVETKGDKNYTTDIKIIFDKRFDNGYMYVFPSAKGSVTGSGHKKVRVPEFTQMMEEYNIPLDNKVGAAFIPMLSKFNYPFKENIWLIGDAGGYADSMTGEGLYYAFRTGYNAAQAIIEQKNFKEINKPMIKEVRVIKRMSQTFYFRPILKLFLWMTTKRYFYHKIDRCVNYYISKAW